MSVVYRIRNGSRFRSGRATIVDRCDDATTELVVGPIGAGDIVDLPATIATRRRGLSCAPISAVSACARRESTIARVCSTPPM